MKFKLTEPNQNYPKARYESENGIWEVGLFPVLFGVRIRAGLRGAGWCTVDYCAGADYQIQTLLLAMIITMLEQLPEDIAEHKISEALPRFEIKPINNDPCWQELTELAQQNNFLEKVNGLQ